MLHGDRNYLRKKYEPTNVESLTEIELRFGQLASIDANLFTGFKNLNILSLSYNKLTALNENLFHTLSNLTELYLQDNQLKSLEINTFKGLGKLTTLSLHTNQLTHLDGRIFNDLVSLTHLYLHNNNLSLLHANIFNDLHNLTYLSLQYNQLSSLDSKIFNSNSNLEHLYLHNNRLNTIDGKCFFKLDKAKIITLYANQTNFVSFGRRENFINLAHIDSKNDFQDDRNEFLKICDNSQNTNARADIIGKSIRNYKIQKLLGSGTFASVYSCIDQTNLSKKAIKVYTAQNNYGIIEDVKKLKNLNCPYIIKFYDEFQLDFNYFVVFEYAEKGDLAQLINDHIRAKREIEISKILTWTIQATEALKTLHSNKIIHRDIKPANIFLSNEDKIKLGDLGVAKIFETMSNSTGNHSFAGTEPYMSPEILHNQAYSYNTDVWSLGCVVYELNFLMRPFGAINERNVEQLDFKNSKLTRIIKEMLIANRNLRPTSSELYQKLKDFKI